MTVTSSRLRPVYGRATAYKADGAAIASALATAGTSAGSITTNSVARAYVDKAKDVPNLLDYITAQADRDSIRAYTNTTEFSTQLQAAIDDLSALGGGELYIPPGKIVIGDIILKTNVALRGSTFSSTSSSTIGTILRGASRDCIIIADDNSGSLCSGLSLSNICIQGNLTYRQRGVYFRNSLRSQCDRLFVHQCSKEAVRISGSAQDAGADNGGRYVQLTRCYLFGAYNQDFALATEMAAVYVNNTEVLIDGCEIGAQNSWSEAGVTALARVPADAELYHKALWLDIGASDCWVDNTILEAADVGLYVQGAKNHFGAITLDGNFGHGCIVKKGSSGTAGGNSFATIYAQRNGRYSSANNGLGFTDSYDAFRWDDTTSVGGRIKRLNSVAATWSGSGFGTGLSTHRYALVDNGPDGSSGSDTNYCEDLTGTALTAMYNAATTNKGGYGTAFKSTRTSSTTGSISLDCSLNRNWSFSNSAGGVVTIVALAGLPDGGEVTLTAVNSSAVLLSQQTVFKPTLSTSRYLQANETVRFVMKNGVALEQTTIPRETHTLVASTASPSPDISKAGRYIWTITAAVTVPAPTNSAVGEEITLVIVQDGTGGWAVTWNAAFKFHTAWSDTGNTAGKISLIKFLQTSSGVFHQSTPQQAYA